MLDFFSSVIILSIEKPCLVFTIYVFFLILVYINTTVHEFGHVSVIRKYSPKSEYKINQYGIYGVTTSLYYEILKQNINEAEIIENAKAGINYQKKLSKILFILSIIFYITNCMPISSLLFEASIYCYITTCTGFAVTDKHVINNPHSFIYPPEKKEWYQKLFYYILLVLSAFILTTISLFIFSIFVRLI